MYAWANAHVQNGLGAEIQWKRDQQIRANLLIQQPELARLVTAIQETSEEIREELTFVGMLRAVDLDRRTFRLELDDDTSIKGTFEDAIGSDHSVTLPKRYRTNIIKTTKVYYSTEQGEVTYRLLTVSSPENDQMDFPPSR